METSSIYHKCAEILGQHAQDVMVRMSSVAHPGESLKLETKSLKRRYAEGVKVSFRGLSPDNKPIAGFFICAFHLYNAARDLARDIAVKMGLGPELSDTREGVENVLGEFLNIIIGLTCSDWTKEGLDINFDPPEKLGGHRIEPVSQEALAYHLTLKMTGAREISIFLNFLF
ncbi:MAG: chemotaxis protein CheX [Deltaproteobacteria bacterium]|jgi:hypothetical protein|nr:chemotaxis protein CheX [Deltaproteobacteria bacterium]